MKYCGVVTDRKWYDQEELFRLQHKKLSWDVWKAQDSRIYSDEVEMADEGHLDLIKNGTQIYCGDTYVCHFKEV